jgi:plastocyanin
LGSVVDVIPRVFFQKNIFHRADYWHDFIEIGEGTSAMRKIFRHISLPVFAMLIFCISIALSNACKKTPVKGPEEPENPVFTQNSEVLMQNSMYNPAYITIARGTLVTWTNKDDMSHTVTSSTGLFDSGEIKSGVSYSYKFTNSGTYTYRCRIHDGMTGTVVVE